jgi:hypothetical protein
MTAPPGAGSAPRPRVLLADDHPAMLALTADALADERFVVGSVVVLANYGQCSAGEPSDRKACIFDKNDPGI